MEIQLYSNSSPKEKVDKAITAQFTLQGYLKEATSETAPTIKIEHAGALTGINYCYIPDFGRYYYIDDIISVKNNIWEVVMRVDVLMSWKNGIRNNNAILARQANLYNVYLKDDQMCLYADTFTLDYYFGNITFGSNRPQYYLTVAGYVSDSVASS